MPRFESSLSFLGIGYENRKKVVKTQAEMVRKESTRKRAAPGKEWLSGAAAASL
jgi:hypothetical protein